MQNSEQIETFYDNLTGWKRDAALSLRAAVRAASEDLVETWKWDTPVWDLGGSVCALGAFKDHLKLNFFKGAALAGGEELFNSGLDAKKSRAINFTEGDAIDAAALSQLVRLAIALNTK